MQRECLVFILNIIYSICSFTVHTPIRLWLNAISPAIRVIARDVAGGTYEATEAKTDEGWQTRYDPELNGVSSKKLARPVLLSTMYS
jgi:hypothetical protein